MELRSLLRTFIEKWWVVVPIFLITLGTSVVFTLSQRPIYEASTTYIVRPSATFADESLSALQLVARQAEILETYAQIAESATVRQLADEAVGINPIQRRRDLTVASTVVPGTQLIRLTAESTDPALARDYANAVGEAVAAYVQDLQDAFELSRVDPAGLPGSPVSPNVPLNLLIGGALGLILALGSAILIELLAPRPKPRMQIELIDPEAGVYTAAYFNLRLREEMSRARRTQQPLSVALINADIGSALEGLTPRRHAEALRRLAGLIDAHVRTEDVAARLDGLLFGLLLPDTPARQAAELVDGLRRRLAVPALGVDDRGVPVRSIPAAGVVEYQGEGIAEEGLLSRARRALSDAETVPAGKTTAFGSLEVFAARTAQRDRDQGPSASGRA